MFVLDSALFSCNRWSPAEPTLPLGLFDIFWGLDSPDDVGTGPKPQHRRQVLGADGTIVHEFSVSMIRAVLPPTEVPELGANFVVAVSDAADMSVSVGVGFARTLDDADVALFESLGGAVRRRFDFQNALTGMLPDSAIAILRAHPDIRFVMGIGFACAQAN